MQDKGILLGTQAASKVYGQGKTKVTALPPTNIEIADGEFVAIMGPSGSGKSTLLNLLSGIEQPSSGEVLFGGQPLSRFSKAQLGRWRANEIGFVFQNFNLVSVFTAAENVELPAFAHGISRAERKDRRESALRLVGLEHRADHLPSQLSGGERQRVALARAMMISPRLLLCDEPTGNLDGANVSIVLDLLDTINQTYGKTVVLVTHDADAAARAQRIVRLSK